MVLAQQPVTARDPTMRRLAGAANTRRLLTTSRRPPRRNSLTTHAVWYRRCLRGLAGQHVVLRGDSLGDGDFALADLTDCSVWLLGRLSALRAEHLTRCRVYGGPICGATFIQGTGYVARLRDPSHTILTGQSISRVMSTKRRTRPRKCN